MKKKILAQALKNISTKSLECAKANSFKVEKMYQTPSGQAARHLVMMAFN
jgi:hypothetical protein